MATMLQVQVPPQTDHDHRSKV